MTPYRKRKHLRRIYWGLVLIFGGFALGYSWFYIWEWMNGPDSAKVQAIGSIFAIVASATIAFAVGWIERNNLKTERFIDKVAEQERIRNVLEICRNELTMLQRHVTSDEVSDERVQRSLYAFRRIEQHVSEIAFLMPLAYNVDAAFDLMAHLEAIQRYLTMKLTHTPAWRTFNDDELKTVNIALSLNELLSADTNALLARAKLNFFDYPNYN